MLENVELEFCKRTDSRYQEIRNRHYIPNNGTHGQQIHFLIYYKGYIVGIISGASSVYGVEARDNYFKIPKGELLPHLAKLEVGASLFYPICNNLSCQIVYSMVGHTNHL